MPSKLSDDERARRKSAVLSFLQSRESAVMRDITEAVDCPKTAIRGVVQKLVGERKVHVHGQKRGAWYSTRKDAKSPFAKACERPEKAA